MTTILVTGMGGELGTRVAQLLEERSWATDIVGVDFVPPRRRLRRAEFRRIDPRERDKLAQFVSDYAPHVIAHFGVYEPASRMTPRSAIERTDLCTIATLSAAARAGQLEYVVLRSGLEVYGPRDYHATVPDEDVMPAPRSSYGVSLLEAEGVGAGLRTRHGVGVCALRYAPVLGSHVPSPLGRLLRLPAVPVPAFSDPPFSVLHPDDAATAMVRAIEVRYDGPLNVVGPGAASPWQAVRLGGRVPVPVLPPFWEAAARTVEIAGAAIAPHVIECMRRGRTGSGARAIEALGLTDVMSTQEVLRELFEWAQVVPLATARVAVA